MFLNYISEGKQVLSEDYREEGKSTEAIEKAFDLTYSIIEQRFNNELKQYNNDEEKAYDELSARKNLNYLRLYVEECLLSDREDIDFYKAVRKHMRDLVNNLYAKMQSELDPYY
jgi:hypothetical protein